MKSLYSLNFTIFLFIILFLPFLLKSLSTELEIYPSIILPSGATKQIFKNNTTCFNNLIFLGYDTKNKTYIINKEEFISPIPIHYVSYILINNFGLNENKTKTVKVRYFGNLIIERKKMSNESKLASKKWLSDKLKRLKLRNDYFLVRWEEITIDLNTRKEISKQIIHEKIIRLL